MMRTRHILLVDDSDMDNYINEAILKHNNAARSIKAVRSTAEALDYLTQRVYQSEPLPDIIFLDLNMPLMDGFSFLEKFAEFPFAIQESSTIVVLTSSLDIDDYRKARKQPLVKHYIQKPLTAAMLEIVFEDQRILPDEEESLFENPLSYLFSINAD